MALSHTFSHNQEAKQSNAGESPVKIDSTRDTKKGSKRKMNRGNRGRSEKAPAKSGAAANSSAGMRSSPSAGRGGRPRRVDDISGLDADERLGGGGRDQIADKRFFDGFIDDFDMSDLS